jgi:hypothetical protein
MPLWSDASSPGMPEAGCLNHAHSKVEYILSFRRMLFGKNQAVYADIFRRSGRARNVCLHQWQPMFLNER